MSVSTPLELIACFNNFCHYVWVITQGLSVALINTLELAKEAHDDIVAGNVDLAYKKILFLINHKPDDPYVLYLFATYHSKKENMGAAMMAYEKAVLLHPEFSESINNLGGIYRKMGRFDQAIATFEKAIAIAKTEKFKRDYGDKATETLADYISNLGSSYVASHNAQKAIDYFDEALALNPNCDNAKWNKALVQLEIGEYEEGFKNYDYGDRQNAKKDRNYRPKDKETPIWNGEKDKTVVVYGEQGIGDELMFATCIPDLVKDCKKVIYDAHPRLYRMFRDAFGSMGVDVYGTRKDHEVAWHLNYDIDYKLPIGSIAKFYRKKLEDFPRKPYLIPDEKCKQKVQERLQTLPKKRLNIGISWKGGTHKSSKDSRVLPMHNLLPLFDSLDANIISLQYHDNALHEIDQFCEGTGQLIHHFKDLISNYDLTLALVDQLDVVISVPQSVIHLCGTANARAFQLCPYNHLWQMGVYGQDMPWYSSVTNIWQRHQGDWAYVIEQAILKVKGEFGC